MKGTAAPVPRSAPLSARRGGGGAQIYVRSWRGQPRHDSALPGSLGSGIVSVTLDGGPFPFVLFPFRRPLGDNSLLSAGLSSLSKVRKVALVLAEWDAPVGFLVTCLRFFELGWDHLL